MSHIAVIDDGIYFEKGFPIKLRNSLQVMEDLSVITISSDISRYYEKYPSHGTICAEIILQYADDIELSSIKVLDKNKVGETKQLVKALEWCLMQDVDVINVSLGSTLHSDYKELRSVLKELKNQNKIIVAASCNRNKYTYPASMDNVIGVRHVLYGKYDILKKNVSEKLLSFDKHDYEFSQNSDDGINIILSGSFKSNDGRVLNLCNSFAAAYVTALVSNIRLKGGDTYDKVLESLAENAINLPKQYCNKTYMDSPCIGIIGKRNQDIESILLALREKFKGDGYNCLSGIAFNYCELANELFDFRMGVKDISIKFEYDICLYGINSARISDEALENNIFDIIIYILDYGWDSAFDNLKIECEYTMVICSYNIMHYKRRNSKNIDYYFDYMEINQLYETILNLYEKEEN